MTTRHKHADVIIAWANGAEIEYRDRPAASWVSAGVLNELGWYENYEYRVKPPKNKYRVGLFKYPGIKAVVSIVNSEHDAERYKENGYFVRWLTDRVEYEE